MKILAFENLPDLPQTKVLKKTAKILWCDESIQAIWIGGSFASGGADVFSDIDFRIAVFPEDIGKWLKPDWISVFCQKTLGGNFIRIGVDAFLHHLVLEDGTIFDFFVQSISREIQETGIHVLGCRNCGFSKILNDAGALFAGDPVALNSTKVYDLVVDFWISSHKYRKTLGRDLHLMVFIGIHNDRMSLLRLWQTIHSGKSLDLSPSIHSLTEMIEIIQGHVGDFACELVGLPLRTEAEMIHSIEKIRDEVSDVGRKLALEYDFDYPDELEEVVRDSWGEFMDSRIRIP